MTGRTDGGPSLYEERSSTTRGAQGLAAARLALQVVRLLIGAKREAAISHKELASRLSVSEGRVSQVLNGDGNVHIATLAKFMNALGYDVEISATPNKPGLKPLRGLVRRTRRGRQAESSRNDYELYEQLFLTGHGPMNIRMYIPTDHVLGCVPEGGPRHIGRVRVSSTENRQALRKATPSVPKKWDVPKRPRVTA